MKTSLAAALAAVKAALLSKEARGPELALARIVLVAISAKLGIDLARVLGL